MIRINELARELEVKPKAILDLLPDLGVSEKKTHSSSIEADVAVIVKQKLLAEAAAQGPKKNRGAKAQPEDDSMGHDDHSGDHGDRPEPAQQMNLLEVAQPTAAPAIHEAAAKAKHVPAVETAAPASVAPVVAAPAAIVHAVPVVVHQAIHIPAQAVVRTTQAVKAQVQSTPVRRRLFGWR